MSQTMQYGNVCTNNRQARQVLSHVEKSDMQHSASYAIVCSEQLWAVDELWILMVLPFT